jgi:hypothetical protein
MYVLQAESSFMNKMAEVVPKLIESTIPTRFEPDELQDLMTLFATLEPAAGWSIPHSQIIVEYLARD